MLGVDQMCSDWCYEFMEHWFSEKTGSTLDILQMQQRLIVLGQKFRVIAFVEVLLNKNN